MFMSLKYHSCTKCKITAGGYQQPVTKYNEHLLWETKPLPLLKLRISSYLNASTLEARKLNGFQIALAKKRAPKYIYSLTVLAKSQCFSGNQRSFFKKSIKRAQMFLNYDQDRLVLFRRNRRLYRRWVRVRARNKKTAARGYRLQVQNKKIPHSVPTNTTDKDYHETTGICLDQRAARLLQTKVVTFTDTKNPKVYYSRSDDMTCLLNKTELRLMAGYYIDTRAKNISTFKRKWNYALACAEKKKKSLGKNNKLPHIGHQKLQEGKQIRLTDNSYFINNLARLHKGSCEELLNAFAKSLTVLPPITPEEHARVYELRLGFLRSANEALRSRTEQGSVLKYRLCNITGTGDSLSHSETLHVLEDQQKNLWGCLFYKRKHCRFYRLKSNAVLFGKHTQQLLSCENPVNINWNKRTRSVGIGELPNTVHNTKPVTNQKGHDSFAITPHNTPVSLYGKSNTTGPQATKIVLGFRRRKLRRVRYKGSQYMSTKILGVGRDNNLEQHFNKYLQATKPVFAFFLVRKRSYKKKRKVFVNTFNLKISKNFNRFGKLMGLVKVLFFNTKNRKKKPKLSAILAKFFLYEVFSMPKNYLYKKKKYIFNRFGKGAIVEEILRRRLSAD